jgi:hypothetical protein
MPDAPTLVGFLAVALYVRVPLYLIVAKFNPTRFGRRKVFFSVSHVPSPTNKVLEEYELLPGGANCGEGDMTAAAVQVKNVNQWRKASSSAEESTIRPWELRGSPGKLFQKFCILVKSQVTGQPSSRMGALAGSGLHAEQ